MITDTIYHQIIRRQMHNPALPATPRTVAGTVEFRQKTEQILKIVVSSQCPQLQKKFGTSQ